MGEGESARGLNGLRRGAVRFGDYLYLYGVLRWYCIFL